MAVSQVAKDRFDGTILIEDGTATTALDVTVQFEDGDLSISGVSADQKEILPFYDRGALYSLKKGQDTHPSISFSAHATDISDGTDEQLWDIINKSGAFSSAVSTYSTSSAAPYTLKVTITVEGTNHGDAADHTIVCDDCVLSIDFAEGEPNTFSISGTVYGTITAT